MKRFFRLWRSWLMPGIFGIDDAIVGAAITAAGTAYAANQSGKAAEALNTTNEDFFHAGNQFNAQQAQWQRDFNASEAWVARQWQEEMANTAYQRQVKDMEKAGLNPMLAVAKGNGAPAPAIGAASSGQASSMSAPQQYNTFKEGLAAGVQVLSTAIQAQNTKMDTALKEAQVGQVTNSAENIKQQTVRIQVELPKLQAEAAKLRTETDTELVRQSVMRVQQILYGTEEALRSQQIKQSEAEIITEKARAALLQLQIPRAFNMSDAQNTWWMKNVAPYLDSLNSAGRLLDGTSLMLRGR